MGFLAPLYALAALAIVGPIVFHLIQRQPRGQKVFSSLMFLTSSPPTLTRRSRLDNLLLLLLRALAIGLVAIAFARPYLRSNSMLNASLDGRRIAIVLDTSASMQRADVWQSAIATVQQLLSELSTDDRVALYTIDDRLQSLVPLEEEPTRPASESFQAVSLALREVRPTWRRSEIAAGLRQVADTMTAAMLTGDAQDPLENQIILVSDLHEGSGLGGLQGYPWPENVHLDVRQIQPSIPGNARITLVRSDEQLSDTNDNLKVRVENNRNSPAQSFQLAWYNAQGPVVAGSGSEQVAPAGTIQVQVMPGQNRVIPVGRQPTGADRLVLLGDSWDGDNQLLLVAPEPTQGTIAFVGPERRQPEEQLDYFLAQAPLGTHHRHRNVEKVEPLSLKADDPNLDAVIYQPSRDPGSMARFMNSYLRGGGTVVIVLSEPLESQTQAGVESLLRDMTGNSELVVDEAATRNFALLSKLDYSHPVFAAFADPRYNDFSKIRFWSHRRLTGLDPQTSLSAPAGNGSAPATTPRVVASFDDGSPFLIEQSIGRGKLWIMTAGWHPKASTFALSSKFVPILLQMLDPESASRSLDRSFEVGEIIKLEEMFGSADIKVNQVDDAAATPDDFNLAAGGLVFNRPGIFRITDAQNQSRSIAVHVPLQESRLEPLDLAVFDQFGVPIKRAASDVQRRETERQRSATELENRQRIWQWLVAGALILLVAETLLAGWTSRQGLKTLEVAS
jgi:hypothetical protein